MKYLSYFNESSQTAKDYKFRRDILPNEIDDILISLKDELINYNITFPTNDFKKVEIDLESKSGNIFKENIRTILHHLIKYLDSENFKPSYYWTESESFDITSSESFDITSTDFDFDNFFELIPDNFYQMYIAFIYD
jgi:hypothetical protein